MIVKLRKQKGIAVLLVIMITGVLLIVSLTISDLVHRQSRLSTYSSESVRAYYAAESGAEEGLFKLRKDIWQPDIEDVPSDPVYFNDNTYYSLEIVREGVLQIIRSEGHYKKTTRKIEASY